ncbi:Ig-like domain-containing protein, partial [Klebsiella pneumoniae]|nr:Ig-like domain-containing protein [Klebsiella pneumoniae]
ASVTFNGKNTATIVPASPLPYNTTCYIAVSTDVTDMDGNALNSSYGSLTTSQFSTAGNNAPIVGSQYPAAGETDVE